MSSEHTPPAGPDLTQGISTDALAAGSMLAGRVGDNAVLLVRVGDEFLAVGATCTHYSAPLAEGIVVGDTVRCPWHHTCFSLRTGEALRPPALNPVKRWDVQRRGGLVFVVQESTSDATLRRGVPSGPKSVVILGGGAASDVAADTLRSQGYFGSITIVSADDSAPYDRPNLSKDYLAGTASEEWIPLRPSAFYLHRHITLKLGTRATGIDVANRRVSLANGESLEFDALLIATGASPVRLPPSVDVAGRVTYLRSLADSRALKTAAETARSAIVLGASFIGLEVAASLRSRGLEVHVVAPEAVPLERIMGPAVGQWIRALHEQKGVVFHLGRTAKTIDKVVTLDNGEELNAHLVIAGIGVRPNDELAVQSGLSVDRGIVVDEHLQTSAPGVYAAGDVARYPDPRTGEHIRVEHWVAAQRQGQTAARNMLGMRERFTAVPFFWSAHYDATINYVGHAERWDDVEISGSLDARDCSVTYRAGGKALAVATVGRNRGSLEAETMMERETDKEMQARA